MSKSDRLTLIRGLAIARGMLASLPGMCSVSHAEVAEEFGRLAVNSAHSAPSLESTADDSSEDSVSDELVTRHLGIA